MSTALQKGLFAEQWNSDIKENGFAQAPFAFFMRSLVDQSLPKTTNDSAKKAADERRGTGSLSFCKKMGGKPSFYDFSSFFFSFLCAQTGKSLEFRKIGRDAETCVRTDGEGGRTGRGKASFRREREGEKDGSGEQAGKWGSWGGKGDGGALSSPGEGKAEKDHAARRRLGYSFRLSEP